MGLLDAVDASTAEHILNDVPTQPGEVRMTALDALLMPLLAQAVTACRDAHDASVVAGEAQQQLLRAQVDGGIWLEPIEERTNELTLRAVGLLVEAHRCSEQVEGVARAVSIAKRDEIWAPIHRQGGVEQPFGLAQSA